MVANGIASVMPFRVSGRAFLRRFHQAFPMPPDPTMRVYRQWLSAPVRVEDVTVTVATKPGVFAHGNEDPAARMLAEAIVAEDIANAEPPGDVPADRTPLRSVHLHAGNGLVPAVAAARGYRVTACDRSKPNATATERTLTLSAAAAAPLHDVKELAAYQVHHVAVPGACIPDGVASLVTIRIPTDRLGVQIAVAEAFRVLAIGGHCLLAGANDEGAKPAARLLQSVFGNAVVDAQHSGHRLVRATKETATPADATIFALPWLDAERFHEVPLEVPFEVESGRTPLVQFTRPGVFSWEHLDEATALLIETMNIRRGDRVLDLGCGAGGLGVVAALQSGARVVLVDADADAVRCARRTARQAGTSNVDVRASDVAEAVDGEAFDVVVTNPPFHVGKATDLTVPQAFIDDAYDALAPGGRLYLVANRTLPYERLIQARFGEVRTAHDGRRFKVLGAVRT